MALVNFHASVRVVTLTLTLLLVYKWMLLS
jgi:hypothetical protein